MVSVEICTTLWSTFLHVTSGRGRAQPDRQTDKNNDNNSRERISLKIKMQMWLEPLVKKNRHETKKRIISPTSFSSHSKLFTTLLLWIQKCGESSTRKCLLGLLTSKYWESSRKLYKFDKSSPGQISAWKILETFIPKFRKLWKLFVN